MEIFLQRALHGGLMMRTAAVCIVVTMFGMAACTNEAKVPVKTEQRTAENQTVQNAGTQQPMGSLSVSILPATATVMDDLEALITGSGTVVGYRWERNSKVIDGENGHALQKNHYTKGDTVTVTAIAADGANVSTSVNIVNCPPQVTAIPFSPPSLYRGVDLSVAPVGFDADGDYVRFHYKWSVNGNAIPGDEPILKGDLFKRGDQVKLTVIPYDNDGDGIPFVSSPIIIPDAPPRFVSTPPADFKGDVYQFTALAEDPDGDVLTYSLSSAPRGMTIDSKSGAITWKIEKDQVGSNSIEVVAQDPEGQKAFLKYSLVITIP
jgi:hypothetical protein